MLSFCRLHQSFFSYICETFFVHSKQNAHASRKSKHSHFTVAQGKFVLSLKVEGFLYHFSNFKDVRAVSAHPYRARNSLPRHALSARAVGEMWRYIALVGTLVSMHGFNSLKCSVTPYFLSINHFLCQLSTF